VIELATPLQKKEVGRLRAGDVVCLSGRIITARDGAYRRVVLGRRPPIDLRGWVVYHCGPLVTRSGKRWSVVSAGPTTSARLDPMQLEFVRRTGVAALVGKGEIGSAVARGLGELGCVYLLFPGGAGVVAARAVERVEEAWWRDLGDAEAMWVLRVRRFGPLIVAVDLRGGNLFSGRAS
jgi:tartrate/fumarate subfamily iron-sulfur-dependent hydro-lyase beta chain